MLVVTLIFMLLGVDMLLSVGWSATEDPVLVNIGAKVCAGSSNIAFLKRCTKSSFASTIQ